MKKINVGGKYEKIERNDFSIQDSEPGDLFNRYLQGYLDDANKQEKLEMVIKFRQLAETHPAGSIMRSMIENKIQELENQLDAHK